MSERVRLADAAKELGCSSQEVREHMKRKLWDLGSAIPPSKSGKKQWEYHIYRSKLDKHLGIEKPSSDGNQIRAEQPEAATSTHL